jgi:hypothetical protein
LPLRNSSRTAARPANSNSAALPDAAHRGATQVKTQVNSIVRKLANFLTPLIFLGIRNLFQL